MRLELTNKIIKNEHYIRLVSKLKELEKDRIFCKHDMEHFLDLARIAVILCSECGIDYDADIIYAAALLHDIGRVEEYHSGIPHDEASLVIASEILDVIGCTVGKKAEIIRLIASHRTADSAKTELEKIFYRADKKSRLCFCCDAADECNWPEYKRNNEIGV